MYVAEKHQRVKMPKTPHGHIRSLWDPLGSGILRIDLELPKEGIQKTRRPSCTSPGEARCRNIGHRIAFE